MLVQREYDKIEGFLRRLAFRIKAFAAIRLLLMAAISALIAILGAMASYYLRDYFPYLPIMLSAILALIFLLTSYGLAAVAAKRLSREELALEVEKHHRELNNYLISSVQLEGAGSGSSSSQEVSGELIAELQRLTANDLHKINPRAICGFKGLWPCLKLALTLAFTLLLALTLSPSMVAHSLSSLIHPIAQIPPQQISIDIEPRKIIALAGEPLALRAFVKGRIPTELGLRIWPEADKYAEEHTMAKLGDDGLFGFTFRPIKSFKFQAYSGRYKSDEGEARIVDAPNVANVSHFIIHPEYTGLGSGQIKSGGHIEALKGSEVVISARSDRPVIKAQLAIVGGSRSDMGIEEGLELKGNMVVTKSEIYNIVVRDENGFSNKDPLQYTIKSLPDSYPSIEVLEPAADLEVDEGELIKFKYLAKDDFGIKEVNILYKEGDSEEKQIAVEKYGEKKTLASGEYGWFIAGFSERGVDAVSYKFQVADSDTISGPKNGFSRTFYLKIRSKEERHKEIASLQKDIIDSVVDLLGDQLESSDKIKEMADKTSEEGGLPRNALEEMGRNLGDLRDKAEQLLAKVDDSVRKLAQDSLSNYSTYLDMNALRNNLAYLRDNLLPRAASDLSELLASQDEAKAAQRALQRQEAITSELEKLATFADKIDKKLRMDDLANLGKKLGEAQEKLYDKMGELGSSPRSELLDAVAQELDKVQQLLKSIMEALAALPSQLPEEFLNSQALKTLDFGDMLGAIERMKEKLRAGDIAGARAELEKLISSLSQMLAALQSASRMAELDFSRAMGGAGGPAQNVLEELAREQSELLRRTRAIEKDVWQRIEDRQKRVIEEIGPISKQRIAELSANNIKLFEALKSLPVRMPQELPLKINQLLNSMAEGMKEGELKDHLAWSKLLRDYLKMIFDAIRQYEVRGEEAQNRSELLLRLEASLAIADSLLRDLSLLKASEENFMVGEEKSAMGEMGQKEMDLRERTASLAEKLAEISKIFPMIPAELVQNLFEASDFMTEASGELHRLSPKGAVPPESEALDRLMKSQESLQQALQEMAQRGSVGATPIPIVVRSGILPGMPPIPDMLRPGVDKSAGGRMGASIEDFKIPGKEDYKVPKIFREELMESLKEGIPEGYKEQVEKYFREIAD